MYYPKLDVIMALFGQSSSRTALIAATGADLAQFVKHLPMCFTEDPNEMVPYRASQVKNLAVQAVQEHKKDMPVGWFHDNAVHWRGACEKLGIPIVYEWRTGFYKNDDQDAFTHLTEMPDEVKEQLGPMQLVTSGLTVQFAGQGLILVDAVPKDTARSMSGMYAGRHILAASFTLSRFIDPDT